MIRRSVVCVLSAVLFCEVHAQTAPIFTAEQAAIGRAAYEKNCASCHGMDLTGTEFAPALLGDIFVRHWADRPISSLFSRIKASMPPNNPGSLSSESYAAILAYIFEWYALEAGSTALSSKIADLDALRMPSRQVLSVRARLGCCHLASDTALPAWAPVANPLDKITPVTEELLEAPPDTSWLSWRRTRDAAGYSPLEQVTRANIRRLRVAWTLALPPGPNQSTPLVHDGVMFVHSYGDNIQALDATNGDELWHYSHELPAGIGPSVHRNISLYNGNVYFSTSDAHVVALDMKTGDRVWQRYIGDLGNNITRVHSGPLAADGVVLQGVIGAGSRGGGYIIGLSADKGELLWRFNTVAQPGEPNGHSWNGLAREDRSGGSIWTAGSYLAKEHLALFGPAPTYNTEPLRHAVDQPGITNDALYTNATIALAPRTGKLVWHYQHLPNDQWDLDWAFERQLVHLTVDGELQPFVITAGKQAIYDALEPATGKYRFSIDLGLQNLITSIDPVSGRKRINSALIPNDRERVTVCPHTGGGKNWMPSSYDSATRMLYVPLTESCMDILPAQRGMDFKLRPTKGSDGRYGRLQAINLESRETTWVNRQRAPLTTGVLATAGGVLFAGSLDRWFTAYAADTGDRLWGTRLSDVPNSTPISYGVNGRQYIAMVVGAGYGLAASVYPFVPEIRPPAAASSAIWVFSLDDRSLDGNAR